MQAPPNCLPFFAKKNESCTDVGARSVQVGAGRCTSVHVGAACSQPSVRWCTSVQFTPVHRPSRPPQLHHQTTNNQTKHHQPPLPPPTQCHQQRHNNSSTSGGGNAATDKLVSTTATTSSTNSTTPPAAPQRQHQRQHNIKRRSPSP
jgi:hypothetical protein